MNCFWIKKILLLTSAILHQHPTTLLIPNARRYSLSPNFVTKAYMAERVAVIRREHFNAAHRLYRQEWDEKTNSDVFGKCSFPNFHGHNYELEVKVVGEVNPETGFVMDMKILSDLVNEKILEKFDHRNLNIDVAEFKYLNPTAENIAIVIHNLLRPHIENRYDLFIRLYETPRNYVEYPAQ